MKLFKREPKVEENKERDDNRIAELAANGIQTMLENGFLVANNEADDGLLYDGKISIHSEMFSFMQGTIEGDDDNNIEKLDRFFKKNIVKELYTFRGKGQLSYQPAALLDIAAFIIGNRDLDSDEPVYIDCITEGVEITCKAAPPEKRTVTYAEYLMNGTLQEAIAACGENGNGYPIITYDKESGELTAAIYLPPEFASHAKPEDVIKTVGDVEANKFREKRVKILKNINDN